MVLAMSRLLGSLEPEPDLTDFEACDDAVRL